MMVKSLGSVIIPSDKCQDKEKPKDANQKVYYLFVKRNFMMMMWL